MGRVIGIPLSKGNSEVVVAVRIVDGDIETMVEGQAVALKDGTPVSGEKIVTSTFGGPGNNAFYGFIMDINRCTGFASCVLSASPVYLPAVDGSAFAAGDAVTIDPVSGLIDAEGTIVTNGVVELADVTNMINGKTGEIVSSGVSIRITGARDVTPAP